MNLVFRRVADWPKLAWLASCGFGNDKVTVYHGPCVETRDDWCVEGVWAGEFEAGDFDRTDIMCGTGVRVRGNEAIFVPPGNVLNRLWHFESDDCLYVSNSLPAILAAADIELIDGHDYRKDLETITDGLYSYLRDIPCSKGALHVTYFHTLVFDGKRVREIERPSTAPHFDSFQTYHDFLKECASRVVANSRSPLREHAVTAMTTVSRGYDSPAVAALAKQAGCRQAVTIRQARSILPCSDSGEEIAEYLDLPCTCYDRQFDDCPDEDALWAAMGHAGDMNLALFDYPEPLALLFVGFYGDAVWGLPQKTDAEQLRWNLASGSRFTEYRLLRGVFLCGPPYWGVRSAGEIDQITRGEEMAPWTLHNKYDRPIARRIAEEAGVPRRAFGVRKTLSAQGYPRAWPFRSDLREDFARFLRARGRSPMPRWRAALGLLIWGVGRFLNRVSPGRWAHHFEWRPFPPNWLFFLWANGRLKQVYQRGLEPFTDDC